MVGGVINNLVRQNFSMFPWEYVGGFWATKSEGACWANCPYN